MKIVFITGGSTGIGAASVTKFVDEGWNVSFMDINVPAAWATPVSVPTSAVSWKLRWLASVS